MLSRIVAWSIQNRLMVVFGAVALVIASAVSAFLLPIDAVPDISAKQVMVNTSAQPCRPTQKAA